MSACKVVDRACVFIVIISAMAHMGYSFEGDKCTLNEDEGGNNGVCMLLKKCKYGQQLIRNGKQPLICGFIGRDPLVCCMTQKQEYSYQCTVEESCMHIKQIASFSKTNTRSGDTSTTTTQKIEFGSFKPLSNKTQQALADLKKYEIKYIIGGALTLKEEFPHMAAIGFGDEDDIQWQCGGTLISPTHILTAAHCIKHKSENMGLARWVRLGDRDLKSEEDDTNAQTFTITETIPHPNYRSPSHYDDLAIMRLNDTVKLSAYVQPACLYTTINDNNQDSLEYVATGWGRTSFAGETSNKLLKVPLKYVKYDACKDAFKNVDTQRLPNGIQESKQICAGDTGKDTCQGDSGGPLQIQRNGLKIVGVTSFGKTCGIGKSPGVYVKVAEYIDWIKSVLCNQ